MKYNEFIEFTENQKYSYPVNFYETNTYSNTIKNYRKLTQEDKKLLVSNVLEFQRYIWWYQNLPCPTYDQMYMVWYVAQSVYQKQNLMVQAQRGIAKSFSSQVVIMWMLLRNKNEKIAVLSATSKRAESWTGFILNMIRETPLLKHMYPNNKQRKSGTFFDINGCKPSDSPSVGAYSITGQKTGMRASFLIYDDVEVPENSDTAGKREKLSKGCREATNLGIANNYSALVLCTPQSSETVYEEFVTERGYKRTIVPAEYPEDMTVYKGDLAPHIVEAIKKDRSIIGTPTDARCDAKHLLKKRLETTTAEYKLQYMLDPTMSDEERYPLRLSDLIVTDLDKDKAPVSIQYGSDKHLSLWDLKHSGFASDNYYSPRYVSNDTISSYEGKLMFIDPSGKGSDETAYCITAQLSGKIFVLDFGGFEGGYKYDTLKKLADKAKEWEVKLIQVESNFGDGSFEELLKPVTRQIYDVAIEGVRAVTNKEKRIIETLEPIINQHRLIFNKKALQLDYDGKVEYRLSYQLTHLTAQSGCLEHDDRIDALAWAVKYWKDSLARDEKKEVERLRQLEKERQFEDFMKKHKIGKFKEKRTTPLDSFGKVSI